MAQFTYTVKVRAAILSANFCGICQAAGSLFDVASDTLTADAAHITPPTGGKPSYRAATTIDLEDDTHENLLFVCRGCHDEIDREEPADYPVTALKERQRHQRSKRPSGGLFETSRGSLPDVSRLTSFGYDHTDAQVFRAEAGSFLKQLQPLSVTARSLFAQLLSDHHRSSYDFTSISSQHLTELKFDGDVRRIFNSELYDSVVVDGDRDDIFEINWTSNWAYSDDLAPFLVSLDFGRMQDEDPGLVSVLII